MSETAGLSTLPLTEPAPASMGVDAARTAYLAENGFTLESYDDPVTRAYVLGIPFSVPNTARHRRAIMLHDLHHVVTGFGTNLTGEGEISAWELGSGLGGLELWIRGIVLFGTLIGLLVAPRRTVRAWRLAKGAGNLFKAENEPEDFLALTVGELRGRLGVPQQGLAHVPRKLNERAPKRVGAAPTTAGPSVEELAHR